MSHPLAIFTPQVGARSETFINRHIQALLPGRTVVVTNAIATPDVDHLSVDCPVLAMNQIQPVGFKRQIVQAVAWKLGWRPGDPLAVAIKHFLEKHQVQVILGEYLDASLPWLSLAHELGIRFFGHAHGYDVSERLRNPKWRVEYLKYNQADGVITMSQASRERLISLGLEATKIHVVPYGVDVPAEPLTQRAREPVRCLAVGRMVAKKAPVLTLDAFRRAAEVCPNLRLDYVGDGVLSPAAQQFVRAFNLNDRVVLHGSQSNETVRRLMSEADIFLQHSMTDPATGDEEGLPVAVLEAMAHSLPVVSTRHAGIPEAVADGLSGFLVEEGDSIRMAERLVALAYDCNLRHQMGQAGWRRAQEQFSWEQEQTHLLRILGLKQQMH